MRLDRKKRSYRRCELVGVHGETERDFVLQGAPEPFAARVQLRFHKESGCFG